MSEPNTYLTDDALEQLIADVEVNEMVQAPPDLMEEILCRIEHESNMKQLPTTRKYNKKKDFQMYCFRVITSVAAAILLLFVMPGISEMQLKLSEVMQEVTDNEMISKEQITPRYATKEEALSDRGVLGAVFGSNKLFGGDMDWEIFK